MWVSAHRAGLSSRLRRHASTADPVVRDCVERSAEPGNGMECEWPRRAGHAVFPGVGDHARERRAASRSPGPIGRAKPSRASTDETGGVRGDAARRRRRRCMSARRSDGSSRSIRRPDASAGSSIRGSRATSPTAISPAAACRRGWTSRRRPTRRAAAGSSSPPRSPSSSRSTRATASRARRSVAAASVDLEGGPAHSALRAAGVFDHLAAGRRQRCRRHRFVDRRQQPARHRRAAKCARTTRGPAR